MKTHNNYNDDIETNVSKNINETKKAMRNKLVQQIGRQNFDNIYTYIRCSREKQIPETQFVKHLKGKYGDGVQKYLFDMDQLIFFEDNNKGGY